LRICLASIHPRALSGQIDALVGLARELKNGGHEVCVVSAFDEARLLDDRLALSDGDRGRLLPKLARIRRIFATLQRRAIGADVVHFNLPTPAFGLLADLLQARVTAPVVVGYEAHMAPISHLIRPGYLLSAPQFYLPRLCVNNGLVARLSSRRAARYIVSSQLQSTELASLGVEPTRIAEIPNVIDLSKCRPCSPALARRSLGLPGGKLIGYLGHFNHVKGVDCLVDAFAEVARMLPDARLVIAWSGLGASAPIQAAIRRLGLADRVIMVGKVDVASFMAAVDVVALPYRLTIGQAAFPGVVLEAMAMGVPLVTSDLPLLREMVADGETALLCPPEDRMALARQIVRLLTDRELARQMTANQKTVVARRFETELLARRYEKVYEDVIDEQARILQPAERRHDVRPTAVRRAERPMGERARTDAGASTPAAKRKSA
jgi:glycosyltransferase involved in cell wall biosynthesis